MNLVSIRIAWACFLGAGGGGGLALLIDSSYPYLFWIGIIVGGLMGYLTYGFRQAVGAFKMAWDKTVPYRTKESLHVTLSVIGVAICVIIAALCSVITLDFWTVIWTNGKKSNLTWIWIDYPTLFFTGGTIILTAVTGLLAWSHPKCCTERMRLIFLLMSPAVALITIPLYHICMLLLLAKLLSPIIKNTFRAIHSDIRLLCATDAAFGSCACYWLGRGVENKLVLTSAILAGAITGALLGILNYKLVSIRWLKLVPKSV